MPNMKTRGELQTEFGLSAKTFKKRLTDYGITLPKGNVDPRWQKLIYETLYYPDGINPKDYERFRLPDDFQESP